MGGFVVPLTLALAGVAGALQAGRITRAASSAGTAVPMVEALRRQSTSVLLPLLVLMSLFSAAAGAVGGQPSAWAWLVAAAAQVAHILSQRQAVRRLGPAAALPSSPQERHRRRRTLRIVTVAAVSMGVGQVAAVAGERLPSPALTGVGAAGILVALVLALAAGWSGVWVPSTPAAPDRTDTHGAAPRPSTTGATSPAVSRQEADLPSPFTTRRSRSARAQDAGPRP